MAQKDYYDELGISPDASAARVRRAFRGLARRYHPDRAGPEGTRRFQDILEAYRVLSDRERRAAYDADRSGAIEVRVRVRVSRPDDPPAEPFDQRPDFADPWPGGRRPARPFPRHPFELLGRLLQAGPGGLDAHDLRDLERLLRRRF